MRGMRYSLCNCLVGTMAGFWTGGSGGGARAHQAARRGASDLKRDEGERDRKLDGPEVMFSPRRGNGLHLRLRPLAIVGGNVPAVRCLIGAAADGEGARAEQAAAGKGKHGGLLPGGVDQQDRKS